MIDFNIISIFSNNDLIASDNLKFKFGKNSSGKYGYYDSNNNLVPFKNPTGNKEITITDTGTTSGIDIADYSTASVTTSGLYKPSGTKYIYSNNTSYDVSSYKYAIASISPTVPSNANFTTFSGSSSKQTMNLQTGHIYVVWFDRQALVVFNYYGEIARRSGFTYGTLSISDGVATMKHSASFCVVDMY